MSNIVIKVENLGKLYRLGEVGTGTLSHDLNRWWAKIRGKEDPYALVGQINDRSQAASSDYVWSLKDINFEVRQGEVLGIIGKNGAGKSTLLKIISQITSPTTGSVRGKGRIASLLEVGTGMNPELTAKENIYLNGAILGMRKKEIDTKFDEIIDFSGCTLYVNTPVKRFSSGMRVRLGFAVAAFLEPEILIVDEVLAVGDAEFQKKAIGKMKDISSGSGRTVLFVSHNMEAVASLCTKLLWLDKGRVFYEGNTLEGIKKYLSNNVLEQTQVIFSESKVISRSGEKRFATLKSISIGKNNKPTLSFYKGDKIEINIEVEIKQKIQQPEIGAAISNFKGQRFHHLVSSWEQQIEELKPGVYKIKISTDTISLYPGDYNISCWIREYVSTSGSDDFIDNAIGFHVLKSEEQMTKQVNAFIDNGGVYLECKWDLQQVQ